MAACLAASALPVFAMRRLNGRGNSPCWACRPNCLRSPCPYRPCRLPLGSPLTAPGTEFSGPETTGPDWVEASHRDSVTSSGPQKRPRCAAFCAPPPFSPFLTTAWWRMQSSANQSPKGISRSAGKSRGIRHVLRFRSTIPRLNVLHDQRFMKEFPCLRSGNSMRVTGNFERLDR
jgi:hypothetical protein